MWYHMIKYYLLETSLNRGSDFTRVTLIDKLPRCPLEAFDDAVARVNQYKSPQIRICGYSEVRARGLFKLNN